MYSVSINNEDFSKAKTKYAIFRSKITEFLSTGVDSSVVDNRLIVKCYLEDKNRLCELLRYSNVRFTVDGEDVYRHLGRFKAGLLICLHAKDIEVEPTKILEEISRLGNKLDKTDWEFAVRNEITLKLIAKEDYLEEYNPFRELQDLLDEHGIINEVYSN